MTEKEIQKAIILWLNAIKAVFIVHSNEMQRKKQRAGYQKGIPDIQVIHNGKTAFFEIKAVGTTSKTYPEQTNWRNKLRDEGCISEITYGYDDTKRQIQRFLDKE